MVVIVFAAIWGETIDYSSEALFLPFLQLWEQAENGKGEKEMRYER